MSQPGSASPAAAPRGQKQRLNVYTMMLVISFIAICIGATLLYMELKRFGDPFGNPPPWNISNAKPRLSMVEPDLMQQHQRWAARRKHASA